MVGVLGLDSSFLNQPKGRLFSPLSFPRGIVFVTQRHRGSSQDINSLLYLHTYVSSFYLGTNGT